MNATYPKAGTLLELTTRLEGNEAQIVQALRSGYTLTGNFRGRELDVLEGMED